MLFREVPATRLVAGVCILHQRFGKLHEIRHAAGPLQDLIELARRAGDGEILPKLIPQFAHALACLRQTLRIARHATMFPDQMSQLPMEIIHRATTIDGQQAVDAFARVPFGLAVSAVILSDTPQVGPGQLATQCVGNYELTICQSLHPG